MKTSSSPKNNVQEEELEELPLFSKNMEFFQFETHIRNSVLALIDPINVKYLFLIHSFRNNENRKNIDIIYSQVKR